jgi:hypothetical protein
MKRFYYRTDGTTSQGPRQLSELRRMQKANQLPADVQVCEEGRTSWRLLSAEIRQETIAQILLYALLIGASVAVALKWL